MLVTAFRYPFSWEIAFLEHIRSWWRFSLTVNALMVATALWTPIIMLGLITLAVAGIALPGGLSTHAVVHGLTAVVSAVAARILNEPISWFAARPRPFEITCMAPLVEHSRGNGFPSNHATGAFALAVGMAGVPVYTELLFVLAVALCAARIYTGLHFVTDVLAGALHGAFAASVIGWLASFIF